MPTLEVKISPQHQERLNHFALRYGFSLAEFTRRILEEISTDLPEESFSDYQNPQKLKASFRRGLEDWRAGRVTAKL